MEGSRQEIFFAVRNRPVVGHFRDMRFVESVAGDTAEPGWGYVYDPGVDTILHIDSITARVMIVPRYGVNESEGLMCGIKMWLAR